MVLINTNIELLNGETENEYLWRLGTLKSDGVIDLGWKEIADLINKNCKDETEYYTECAYRKRYAAAKQFYDEIFSKENFQPDDTQDKLRELERMKTTLRDERIAYNKQNRDAARLDANFSYLSEQLKEIGRVQFPELTGVMRVDSTRDIIVNLSDLHIGTAFTSAFGEYNSDIAKRRLNDYLEKAIEIGKLYNAENAYVNLLGDLVNGNIRLTVQVSNRENLIDQIKLSAEFISSFVFELSKHFKNVYVTGVSGNHSRLVQNKEDALKDERADSLILWICQQMLSHTDNIVVDTDLIDTSLTSINVRGKEYALVHGDNDAPTDASIGKLVTMLGFIPYAVLAGHRHSLFYKEVNGIRFVQAGSLCGSGGDYEIQKRLTGKANQTILVVNSDGIEAIHNVKLD